MGPTLIAALCAAVLSPLAQSEAPSNLDALLRLADARRQEYTQSFRSLTSVETRVTELFDRNGRPGRQRTVVSDFLVYSSDLNGEVSEYRVAREVDGRPVGNPAEDGIRLFKRLASSRTLAQESARLREANRKHALRYAIWGLTLHWPRALHSDFADTRGIEFAMVGRERLHDRDLTVIGYQSRSCVAVAARGSLIRFTDPRVGLRGRVWLAADGQLLRHEEETLVSDREITTAVVVSRIETEYHPSTVGLMAPRQIVVSFFDKAGGRRPPHPVYLAGRITITYEAFKRFDVTTESDVQLPDQTGR